MEQAGASQSSPAVADGAGLVASIACAIHCAAMPLVIGYLPMLGLSWLADPTFHRVMAIVCFALALAAFLPGWRRHGSLTPTLLGTAGIALLSLAAFGLEGSCCPACESIEPPEPAASMVVVCDDDSLCDDADCPACQLAGAEAVSPSAPAAESSFWFTPFITPLGGVLLVLGHLSNHRQSCQCCGREACSGQEGASDAVQLG